jgi:ubiquinone/menaquinone biosynthesis C-methylase UbiE
MISSAPRLTRTIPPYRCPDCGSPLRLLTEASASCSACDWGSPPGAGVLTLIGSDGPDGEKQYYDAEYAAPPVVDADGLDLGELAHHWQSLYYPMNRDVWDALGPLGGKDILLLGNGTSEKELYFLTRSPRRMIVSDLSPNALRTVRERLRATDDRSSVDFVALDAQHLPLADASVDLVYGYAFVHHLADIDRFLAETHRVLRPGGRCVFMDNRYSPAWQALKLGVLRPLMGYFHRRELVSPEDLRATLTGWYREEELAEKIIALGAAPYFRRSSFFHYLFTRASERLPPQRLFRWAASRPALLRALIALDRGLERFSVVRANQIRLVWGFTKR